MTFHLRETVFGAVLGVVSFIVIAWSVIGSPQLSSALGVNETNWINGILIVELIRSAVVAVIAVTMVRQRHGLTSRLEALVAGVTMAAAAWVLYVFAMLALGLVAGSFLLSWSMFVQLGIWTAGALVAPVFVAPGAATRVDSAYVSRLDREREEQQAEIETWR